MRQYIVGVCEVWVQKVVVMAETEADAIEHVSKGDGKNLGNPKYLDALDPARWDVELA